VVLHQVAPALVGSVESGSPDPTKPPPGTDDTFTIAGVPVHVFERYESSKGTLWMWHRDGIFAQFVPSGQEMEDGAEAGPGTSRQQHRVREYRTLIKEF
jgi:hypothetical protein